jgi:hypothetical protein
VTLPEVITGNLAGKFGEISLYNQHTDFESGSASNLNLTSLWVTACESATEPSCADAHSTSTSHMASAMLAGPMQKLSLHAGPARRSSPTTLQTPTPPPATTRTPPTSSTLGRILMSLLVFKPLDLHGRYPQQGRRWGSPCSGTRRYVRGHKTRDLYRFG